jgi:hypothetical protein
MKLTILQNSNIESEKSIFKVLLNQSISLGSSLPSCVYNGYEKIDLIKPDKTRKDFEDDISLIGITKDTMLTENGIKITVHRAVDLGYSEIRIYSNFSVISIKYGINTDNERLRYLQEIKDKSEQLLWLRERQHVLELNEYSFNWNKSDIEALSSIGSVADVAFKYIKDPNFEPLIVCDPNNIKFYKTVKS